jgi:heat shock protein beta
MKLEFLLVVLVFTLYLPSVIFVATQATDNVPENIKTVPLKTSDNTVQQEAQANSPDGFSVADRALLRGEEHNFKAEINQLMSIIINSLYSNRDIFIRELISNSADAISKIRFLSLQNDKLLGNTPQLEIRIKVDKDNKILHIRDTGIGMTKNDLVNNLGSIAKSGTKEFIEKLGSSSNTVETIGQFGVGFYSSFLVAQKVTVTSKNNDDDQYIWEGDSDNPTAYTVAKDPRGDTLGRGTLISLHIKDDALEYLETSKLKELISRYNEFISYPIYLWTSHEVSKEVPVEDDEEDDVEDTIEEEDLEIEDTTNEETPKTKTVTETVWDWERINPNPPLWTRSKSDITSEDYIRFYKDVLGSHEEPIDYLHFKAEGDVEFTALIYIPSSLPFGMWEPSFKSQFKLYVKRVFITDNFDEMIPDYLGFLKGIVDSDDITLNVSREMLQENKTLGVIKKKLVRKIIGLIQDLADDKDNTEKWDKFYKTFSTNLKLGVINDSQNRVRLSKLLRFRSAKNPEQFITLEQYVEKMKKGQEEIFYLGGETLESIKSSPLLEGLIKRGYDVLLLPEPIDEYTVSTLGKYDDKFSFKDISKEGLKLSESEEEKLKQLSVDFEPVTNYLKDVLQDKVLKVQISNKLAKAPCAILSQSWGYSANMERIMKAQALKDDRYSIPSAGKRVLEINPRHPIIKRLLTLVSDDNTDESTEDIAHVLYDVAILNSGYSLNEPADLTGRINKLVAASLDIDPSLEPEEEVFEEEVDEEVEQNEEPRDDEEFNEEL